MALVKITFDSASVSAKQDADCNHFLASNQNGRIIGLGGNVAVTTSNNYIILSSGYVQVYGRRVYVEANTKIAVALTGSAYGYVFIKFDLGNNEVSLEKKEAPSSYPSLIQENLQFGGLIYELPVARYTKTASSLNLDYYYDPPEIVNADTLAEARVVALDLAVKDRYGPVWQMNYSSVSGKFFTYDNIKTSNASNGFGNVNVAGWNVVFSTAAASGSGAIYQYKFNGTWYDVAIQLKDTGLVVEPALASHAPGRVYVAR